MAYLRHCTACASEIHIDIKSVQAEFTVHIISAEAAEPLNMVGMGESPCYDETLLFDCGRSRTSEMH